MSLLVHANLGLRFLLELAALAALALWGFRTGDSTSAQLALGVGLPLALALAWGAFIGPNASTTAMVKAVLQVTVFGIAALALAATSSPGMAGAFVALVVANAALMAVFDRRAVHRPVCSHGVENGTRSC